MKTKLNIKSALVGLAVGIVVTLGVGAASAPGGPAGRYQVAGAGNTAVIVDTVTGKAWRSFMNPNGGQQDGNFFAPKDSDAK